jgi:hypothetical protein
MDTETDMGTHTETETDMRRCRTDIGVDKEPRA